ncbi:MAG: threonylcarbamoyl-AMP synthase [Deltaproteobacteria bacterium]|nr:threonylcarbamoyl-AMP synthase [Deltaproteobacteria bacterium]
MRIEIDEWASQGREVHRAAKLLDKGGVLAIPTDSGYALACDLHSKKATERIYALKQSPRSHPLSIIFADLDHIGGYTGYVSTLAWRTMKRLAPGPFVFVLQAGREVPKNLQKKRKEVGIRIPAADIPRAIALDLGRPLATTSLRMDDEDGEETWVVDPVEIERRWGHQLDAVVDGGLGIANPTTVVDLRNEPFEILREGQGDVTQL